MVGVSATDMDARIFCTFQQEGWHRCPKAIAKAAGEAYLAHRHRHMFHVRIEVQVDVSREIEFIGFKRDAQDLFRHALAIGEEQQSCEDLAIQMIFAVRRLLEIDDFETPVTVEVSEDGENGAIITFPGAAHSVGSTSH